MFSTEIIATIAATDAIIAGIVPFHTPGEKTVEVNEGDSTATILDKIMAVEGARHELWFTGLIVDNKGKTTHLSTKNTVAAIRQLQTEKKLPSKVKMNFIGLKDTPSNGMHPKFRAAIAEGKFRLPQLYRVYAAKQKMVELCFILEVGKTSKGYGMACGVSNFNEIPGDPITLLEFGVEVDPTSWKYAVITSLINTTEKFIQIWKCAAQNGKTFKSTELKDILGALQKRVKLLSEFGHKIIDDAALAELIAEAAEPTDEITKKLLDLNDKISTKMMEIMCTCVNAKEQKKLGRGALIKAIKYFPTMDGKAFNPDAPNYAELGVNAVFMTLGTMIRIYRGDEQVISLVDICKTFDIMFLEAAVHCAEEATIDGKKVDTTYGSEPDGAWGSTFSYPRESPDFDEVTAYSEIKDANKVVTGHKQRQANGAFGAGLAMLMAARFDESELGQAARKRLGVDQYALMEINRETIRIVAQAMVNSIEE